jgi:hypothetical protein
MWQRFLRAFGIVYVATLGSAILLLLLVDPLSVSPVALVMPKHGYALKDRRFLAPQVIRSGQFDSFLVGSSTIHSVDPAWAEAAFGGRFANIAIHGVTPYELTRVLGLVGSSVPGLRRLILGLDADQWCDVRSAQRYHVKAVRHRCARSSALAPQRQNGGYGTAPTHG